MVGAACAEDVYVDIGGTDWAPAFDFRDRGRFRPTGSPGVCIPPSERKAALAPRAREPPWGGLDEVPEDMVGPSPRSNTLREPQPTALPWPIEDLFQAHRAFLLQGAPPNERCWRFWQEIEKAAHSKEAAYQAAFRWEMSRNADYPLDGFLQSAGKAGDARELLRSCNKISISPWHRREAIQKVPAPSPPSVT